MAIFDKRVAFKPYEYPHILRYKEAINHSYWLVSEWNFLSDVQDFHVRLTPAQRNVVKNTLLAISQIEVSVKRFWTKLGDRFPKAEFELVGVTFGECEVRHSESYAQLLQVLTLNDDFEELLKVPAIKGRVDYLSKYLANAGTASNEEYLFVLTLFSLFIENISLFSQFAIMKSFNKHLNILKDVDNVISSTAQEEAVHALLGVAIINDIKKEYPEWFTPTFYKKVYDASRKSYAAECSIIDWIFEDGELDFISKDALKEFLKNRFNDSLTMIGGQPIFEVDKDKLKEFQWFEDELQGETSVDFFHQRPTSYSKSMQAITAEDIF